MCPQYRQEDESAVSNRACAKQPTSYSTVMAIKKGAQWFMLETKSMLLTPRAGRGLSQVVLTILSSFSISVQKIPGSSVRL